MKTPEEIARLKNEWCSDPVWNLADTPGFEEHREELEEYDRLQSERWRQERLKWLLDKADALGCPGNIRLVRYVERLERRIAALEKNA